MNSQISILFWKGGTHEKLMILANIFLLYGLQERQQIQHRRLNANAAFTNNVGSSATRRNVSHATVSEKQIHR
ncbi:hypothetical protein TSUD_22670 [Trifolium subterraneum]|uniref:Uncharacterized protein n=1 Tax=Trifolium subterraneum TaxID=3900 RepID=A0A2Z6N2B0_TRISU|nr:hypothetical protein TSUD_22670 [Trifolium subterraneum]